MRNLILSILLFVILAITNVYLLISGVVMTQLNLGAVVAYTGYALSGFNFLSLIYSISSIVYTFKIHILSGGNKIG